MALPTGALDGRSFFGPSSGSRLVGVVWISTLVPGLPVSKAIAILGSALFFVVAPLVLAGFVPWWITHWEFRPAFFGFELTRAVGLLLIIAGVPGVVDSSRGSAAEAPTGSRVHCR